MQHCNSGLSSCQNLSKDPLQIQCKSEKITQVDTPNTNDFEQDHHVIVNGNRQPKICSLVSSPTVFDFCEIEQDENSQSTKESSKDPAETEVMSEGSAFSYESPDAVSLNSLDGFSSCEKNEDENYKIKNKNENKSVDEDIDSTKNGIELNEREECSLDDPDNSLLNYNGRPLFVSSFDYHHKSLNFDVLNEYAEYLNKEYEHHPANSRKYSRSTSHSQRCKYAAKHSPRSRRHRSHSTVISTRHKKHINGSSHVKVHSHSIYYKHHKTTRYFSNYNPAHFAPSLLYKPQTPNYYSSTKTREPKSTPIDLTSEPKFKNNVVDDPIKSAHAPLTKASSSAKMIADSYKCPECSYTASLNQVTTHYGYRHFAIPCPSCDKKIEEPFFLQHCKYCRTSKAKLECPNCPLTCTGSSLLSLGMHVMCTHPIKKCIACEDDFIPHKFIEHAKVCFFGPKHRYTCPFCECSVAATKLTEHIVSHPITECPLCFSDICYHEAEKHMESCYLEKVNDSEESFSGSVFNCPLCQHRFSFENMSHHIVLMHLTLNCVFCFAGMSHDQMRDHVLLCCQQHQNKTEDSKE